MDSTVWVYVFVLGLVPVIGVGALLAGRHWSRAQRERGRDLAAFAAARGLRYRRRAPADHQARYANFHPLGQRRGDAAHVIDGRGGIEWDLFDYAQAGRYSVRERAWIGVVAARAPGLNLPRARIRPQTVLHTLIDAAELRDVQTGSRTFDHRFRVSGDDADAVRRFFDAGVTACLMAHPADHDWRMHGDTIVIIHHTPYGPDELPAVMTAVEEFVTCARSGPPAETVAAALTEDNAAPIGNAIGPLSS